MIGGYFLIIRLQIRILRDLLFFKIFEIIWFLFLRSEIAFKSVCVVDLGGFGLVDVCIHRSGKQIVKLLLLFLFVWEAFELLLRTALPHQFGILFLFLTVI